jgi:hypothetical protein
MRRSSGQEDVLQNPAVRSALHRFENWWIFWPQWSGKDRYLSIIRSGRLCLEYNGQGKQAA